MAICIKTVVTHAAAITHPAAITHAAAITCAAAITHVEVITHAATNFTHAADYSNYSHSGLQQLLMHACSSQPVHCCDIKGYITVIVTLLFSLVCWTHT